MFKRCCFLVWIYKTCSSSCSFLFFSSLKFHFSYYHLIYQADKGSQRWRFPDEGLSVKWSLGLPCWILRLLLHKRSETFKTDFQKYVNLCFGKEWAIVSFQSTFHKKIFTLDSPSRKLYNEHYQQQKHWRFTDRDESWNRLGLSKI